MALLNRYLRGTVRFTKDRPIGRRFVELISQRIERAAGEKNKKLHLEATISVKKNRRCAAIFTQFSYARLRRAGKSLFFTPQPPPSSGAPMRRIKPPPLIIRVHKLRGVLLSRGGFIKLNTADVLVS